jgi:hypothetical protein
MLRDNLSDMARVHNRPADGGAATPLRHSDRPGCAASRALVFFTCQSYKPPMVHKSDFQDRDFRKEMALQTVLPPRPDPAPIVKPAPAPVPRQAATDPVRR